MQIPHFFIASYNLNISSVWSFIECFHTPFRTFSLNSTNNERSLKSGLTMQAILMLKWRQTFHHIVSQCLLRRHYQTQWQALHTTMLPRQQTKRFFPDWRNYQYVHSIINSRQRTAVELTSINICQSFSWATLPPHTSNRHEDLSVIRFKTCNNKGKPLYGVSFPIKPIRNILASNDFLCLLSFISEWVMGIISHFQYADFLNKHFGWSRYWNENNL